MPLVIHKFELAPVQKQTILLPEGAKVRFAAEQRHRLMLWAEHTGGPMQPRQFSIYGTGAEILSKSEDFLVTVLMADGNLVFHIYEDRS